MTLLFELTMPGVASWNGRWSGEGKRYLFCKTFTTTKGKAKAEEILKIRDFGYSWPDGWYANVEVSKIESRDKRKFTKLSSGFCGYDWMANSIVENLTIKT